MEFQLVNVHPRVTAPNFRQYYLSVEKLDVINNHDILITNFNTQYFYQIQPCAQLRTPCSNLISSTVLFGMFHQSNVSLEPLFAVVARKRLAFVFSHVVTVVAFY